MFDPIAADRFSVMIDPHQHFRSNLPLLNRSDLPEAGQCLVINIIAINRAKADLAACSWIKSGSTSSYNSATFLTMHHAAATTTVWRETCGTVEPDDCLTAGSRHMYRSRSLAKNLIKNERTVYYGRPADLGSSCSYHVFVFPVFSASIAG